MERRRLVGRRRTEADAEEEGMGSMVVAVVVAIEREGGGDEEGCDGEDGDSPLMATEGYM